MLPGVAPVFVREAQRQRVIVDHLGIKVLTEGVIGGDSRVARPQLIAHTQGYHMVFAVLGVHAREGPGIERGEVAELHGSAFSSDRCPCH